MASGGGRLMNDRLFAPRPPESSWKMSESRPKSSPLTGMWYAIMHEGSRIQTHFVVASFAAGWTKGEPRLSDAVDWGSSRGLAPPATPEPGEILGSAARIEGWRTRGGVGAGVWSQATSSRRKARAPNPAS